MGQGKDWGGRCQVPARNGPLRKEKFGREKGGNRTKRTKGKIRLVIGKKGRIHGSLKGGTRCEKGIH